MSETMDKYKAATVIQAYFRGHLARKEYARELLQLFEMEEAQRREKELLQVWEGEILIERHRLVHEIYDNKTLSSNEQRKLNAMAIRIQRAWRYKKTGVRCDATLDMTPNVLPSVPLPSDSSNVNRASLFANNGSLKTKEFDGNTDVSYKRKASRTPTFNGNDNHHHHLLSKLATSESIVDDVLSQNCSVRDTNTKVHGTLHGTNGIAMSNHDQLSIGTSVRSPCVDSNNVDALKTSASGFQVELTPSLDGSEVLAEHDTKNLKSVKRRSSTMSYGFSTTSLDAMDPAVGSSENVIGNRYRLCYTLELSDSSIEDVRDTVLTQSMDSNSSYSEHSDTQDGSDLTTMHLKKSEEDTLPKLRDKLPSLLFENRTPIEPKQNELLLQCHDWNDQPDSESELDDTVSAPSDGAIHTKHSLCHDHRNSPLHGMKVQQLVQLIHLLETKLNGLSKALVTRLEEREILRSQNKLLHANIEQLTRRVQQMYTPTKSLRIST